MSSQLSEADLIACAHGVYAELLEQYTERGGKPLREVSGSIDLAKRVRRKLGEAADQTIEGREAWSWTLDLIRYYYQSELQEMGWLPEDETAIDSMQSRIDSTFR